MTNKTTVCAMAVALLAGTAAFAVPAAAQGAPMQSSHSKKLFLSAVAVYDAGLRRGTAKSSRSAYLRGFRDGTSSEAYSSRSYLVDSYTGYQPPAPAPAPVYSSYDRGAVYAPGYGGYSSYNGRSAAYGDGNGYRSVAYGDGYSYRSDRYDAGYVPSGLMDVAVVPVAAMAAPASEVRTAHWSYCAARYQTFDPASDTFLAADGNRYFCR
jgi:BA14K-like protein